MGYPANARTDERGHRVLGVFPGGMKTVPLVQKRVNVWGVGIARDKYSDKIVGDLLGVNSKFHLIGSHLVNDLHIIATTICRCGKSGVIRSVILNDEEYRSDSYRLYKKRVPRETGD